MQSIFIYISAQQLGVGNIPVDMINREKFLAIVSIMVCIFKFFLKFFSNVFRVGLFHLSFSCSFIASIISFFVLSVIFLTDCLLVSLFTVSLIHDNEINEISVVSNVDITLFKAKMAISCC